VGGMTVGVVIASVDRPRDLFECLQSVARQTVAADEIVVVAQAGDPQTAAVAREAGAKVVLVEQPGLAMALESGIAGASTDVIAFIDDDARASESWLAQVRQAFLRCPELGLLGGRDNVGGDAVNGHSALPVGIVRRGKVIGNHHRGHGPAREVHHVKGANMSMRREAVALIPLARLVAGSGAQVRNEFVLSLGVLAQGYRIVYDPAVQVDHFPAERGTGDGRARSDAERTFVRRSNEAAAFAFAGMWMKAAPYVVRAVLIGDHVSPGLLLAATQPGGFKRLRAGVSGVSDGFRRGVRLRQETTMMSRA